MLSKLLKVIWRCLLRVNERAIGPPDVWSQYNSRVQLFTLLEKLGVNHPYTMARRWDMHALVPKKRGPGPKP